MQARCEEEILYSGGNEVVAVLSKAGCPRLGGAQGHIGWDLAA